MGIFDGKRNKCRLAGGVHLYACGPMKERDLVGLQADLFAK
jgi:hypothetical protein